MSDGMLGLALVGGIIAYLWIDPKPSTWSIGGIVRHNKDGSWTVFAGKPKRKKGKR